MVMRLEAIIRADEMWGVMRAVHLLLRLAIYYATLSAVVLAGVKLFPGVEEFLPIGGAESLLSGPGGDPFESVEIGATRVSNLGDSLIWFINCRNRRHLDGAASVVDLYAIRKRSEYDQSLVETIMLLPIAVTSIVIIVHNSLALAFSLAGIVGGVRFSQHIEKLGGRALHIAGDRHRPGRRYRGPWKSPLSCR